MSRPPKDAAGAKELGERLVREATTADELRAAQAVLLPLSGHSLVETARLVGKDPYWVSRTRNRILKGGPLTVGRGGRRRSLLTAEDEFEFMLEALGVSGERRDASTRGALRELIYARTSTWPNDATITRLIDRVAPRLFPGMDAAQLQRWSHALKWFWKGARLLRSALGSKKKHGAHLDGSNRNIVV